MPKRARFGRRRHGGRRVWNAEEWERGACGLSLSGSFLQAFSAAGVRGHGPRGGCGRRGYGCAGQACAQALAGPTAVSWPGCALVAAPLVISGLPRAAREDSGRCGALLRRQALVCARILEVASAHRSLRGRFLYLHGSQGRAFLSLRPGSDVCALIREFRCQTLPARWAFAHILSTGEKVLGRCSGVFFSGFGSRIDKALGAAP